MKLKFLVFIIFLTFLLSGCNVNNEVTNSPSNLQTESASKLVKVKYRDDSIDVGKSNFEYFSTSSSFVNGVWYDQNNKYLIIKLNTEYYHYCNFDTLTWKSFKNAKSFGNYYNSNIKGKFDCRKGFIPDYN